MRKVVADNLEKIKAKKNCSGCGPTATLARVGARIAGLTPVLSLQLFLKSYFSLIIVVQIISCSGASRIPIGGSDSVEKLETANNIVITETDPIINLAGWTVPLATPHLIGKEEKSAKWSLENGDDQKVLITIFPVKGEINFMYNESPDSSLAFRPNDRLVLVGIKSVSIENHIFAYIIWARKKSDTSADANNDQHGHPFVYQIFDRDGDGKFESMYLSASNSVVPSWVKKRISKGEK